MANAYDNFLRVQRNVGRMLDQDAPDSEVEAYLQEEGYTKDDFVQASQRVKALGGARPPDLSGAGGFAARAANSALFNFGDELAAAAQSAFSDQTYDQTLAANRMALDEYARQNPKTALAADITGALLPAVVSGGTALAGRGSLAAIQAARASAVARETPTLLGTVGRGMAVGGAQGALSGAGAGEDLKGRGVGALTGGAAGATLGGAFGGAATVGNVARERAGGVGDDASRYFMSLINRENQSLNDVSAELARREGVGVSDNIVADVMGPAFRSEMRGAATQSAPLRRELTDTLNNRAREQGTRVRGALEAATGAKVTNTAREGATRVASANTRATPLYEAFRQRPPFVDDPVFTRLLSERPALSSALSDTQRSLLNAGVRDPSGVRRVEVPAAYPGVSGPLPGTSRVTSTLTPNALDRMVKITGASAEDARNVNLSAAARNEARDVMEARGALLSRADELAPEYAQARQLVATAKTFEEQAAAGRQFLDADSGTAEVLLRAAKTPEEKAAFQQGVLDAMNQRLQRSRNVAGRVNAAVPRIADEASMARLADAFPQFRGQPYDRLVQQLEALAQQSGTRNQFLGGMTRGATGSAVSEDAALAATSGEMTSALTQGNLAPGVFGSLTRGLRERAAQRGQDVRAAAAPYFTAQGSRQINPFFDQLAALRARDTAVDSATRTVPGMVGGAAASASLASNVGNVAESFGVSKDQSVGPNRQVVDREIQRIEAALSSGAIAPADRAAFEDQLARLKAMR